MTTFPGFDVTSLLHITMVYMYETVTHVCVCVCVCVCVLFPTEINSDTPIHSTIVHTLEVQQYETLDPVWYETLRLLAWLPDEGIEKNFAPDVVLGVWDEDRGSKDEFVGMVRLPLSEAWKGEDHGNPVTQENWFSLKARGMQGGGESGELLVAYELIRYGREDDPQPVTIKDEKDLQDKLDSKIKLRHLPTKPPPLMKFLPIQKTFEIKLVVLGLRNLRLLSWSKDREGSKAARPTCPFVRFEVGYTRPRKKSLLGTVSVETDKSKLPSPENPSFRTDPLTLKLLMPVDPVFAPTVAVRVHDSLFGGLRQPLIGVTTITLHDRMPGTGDRQTEWTEDRMTEDPTIAVQREYLQGLERQESVKQSLGFGTAAAAAFGGFGAAADGALLGAAVFGCAVADAGEGMTAQTRALGENMGKAVSTLAGANRSGGAGDGHRPSQEDLASLRSLLDDVRDKRLTQTLAELQQRLIKTDRPPLLYWVGVLAAQEERMTRGAKKKEAEKTAEEKADTDSYGDKLREYDIDDDQQKGLTVLNELAAIAKIKKKFELALAELKKFTPPPSDLPSTSGPSSQELQAEGGASPSGLAPGGAVSGRSEPAATSQREERSCTAPDHAQEPNQRGPAQPVPPLAGCVAAAAGPVPGLNPVLETSAEPSGRARNQAGSQAAGVRMVGAGAAGRVGAGAGAGVGVAAAGAGAGAAAASPGGTSTRQSGSPSPRLMSDIQGVCRSSVEQLSNTPRELARMLNADHPERDLEDFIGFVMGEQGAIRAASAETNVLLKLHPPFEVLLEAIMQLDVEKEVESRLQPAPMLGLAKVTGLDRGYASLKQKAKGRVHEIHTEFATYKKKELEKESKVDQLKSGTSQRSRTKRRAKMEADMSKLEAVVEQLEATAEGLLLQYQQLSLKLQESSLKQKFDQEKEKIRMEEERMEQLELREQAQRETLKRRETERKEKLLRKQKSGISRSESSQWMSSPSRLSQSDPTQKSFQSSGTGDEGGRAWLSLSCECVHSAVGAFLKKRRAKVHASAAVGPRWHQA